MSAYSVQMAILVGLLILWTVAVYSAPLAVETPDGCYTSRIKDPTSSNNGLFFSCELTRDNRELVLRAIKQPYILALDITIYPQSDYFVFNDNSFSRDLKNLTISSIFPFWISSRALSRSTSLEVLCFHQIHDVDIQDAKSIYPQYGGDIDLTSPAFGRSWLVPVTGLLNITLSKCNISSFRLDEFCALHQLQSLYLSHNRINKTLNLGISHKYSNSSNTPCLPNLNLLDISHNPIYDHAVKIADKLPSLQYLDFSHCFLSFLNLDFVLTRTMKTLFLNKNNMVSVSLDHFCNKSKLQTLSLQDNKLQDISLGFFACMDKLYHLNVSNNSLTHNALHMAGLNNLTQLQWLDLSYNPVKTLHSSLIGNLTELLEFNCTSCGLIFIGDETFNHLVKLRILQLARNMLHVIDGGTFSHLGALQILDLTWNHLSDTDFISSMPPIQEMYLAHNQLQRVPGLGQSWQTLSVLRLEGNIINRINLQYLSNLTNLKELSLAFNVISTIPNHRVSLPSLEILNLNSNHIKTIGYYAFDGLRELIHLRLDNNNLIEYPPMKEVNHVKLKTLNLSRNSIKKIEDFNHQAESIDLSFNEITNFDASLTFLTNLKFLNLSYNKLETLAAKCFITETRPRPKVYLLGNPLLCDCHMAWLLDTMTDKSVKEIFQEKVAESNANKENGNLLSLKNVDGSPVEKTKYIAVPDLYSLQCINSATGRAIPFSSITQNDFICRYNGTCYRSTCKENCCHEDGCPCNSFCYTECECYHGYLPANTNFMNCSSRNMVSLPAKGPTYVDKIYLDGNNITRLNSSTLSFPQVQMLFLNSNHISNIEVDAFRKLPKLRLLDLHHNHIGAIRTETFRSGYFLQELYLQKNQINFIENNSLSSLPSLTKLWLHENNLEYINLSIVSDSLTEVTLHGNPWLCDCQFGPAFKQWIVTHIDIILNYTQISCNMKVQTEMGLQEYRNVDIRMVNFAHCGNNNFRHIKSTTEIVSLVAAFFLFALTAIIIYKKRILLRVWMCNKCGIWFHHDDNNDFKPYDVFIAYDKKDEKLVVRELLPALEEGELSYKVCLECRDWPAGTTKTDAIVASVQQSRRTIVVVSTNHLDTQWCEFSFDVAHYRVLKDKQIHLILVLTERDLEARLTRAMKFYMNTNAFLVIGEKGFWEKLRYLLSVNPRGADEVVGRGYRPIKVY